jgi:hypothetical protein
MEFGQVAEIIELPDNSGRCRVAFRPRSLSAGTVIADVTVTMESIDEPCASELTVTAFPLSLDGFVRLEGLLAVWLADRTPFDVELSQERWARLTCMVEVGPDLISSLEKPAFRIEVNWCGMKAMTSLVVDQSCMRLFHEGVSGWLQLGRLGTR